MKNSLKNSRIEAILSLEAVTEPAGIGQKNRPDVDGPASNQLLIDYTRTRNAFFEPTG